MPKFKIVSPINKFESLKLYMGYMLKKYKIIFLLPCLITLLAWANLDQSKHVVGFREAGLFSNFIQILHHIHYCQQRNLTPVIYWDSNSHYYDENGWNGEKLNVWEYYFEPVSDKKYSVSDTIHYSYMPDSFELNLWPITTQTREFAKELIDRFIKIKKPITDKVESFYRQNFDGKYTIGIHYRGTDAVTLGVASDINKVLSIANHTAETTNTDKPIQFFIATDQQSFLDLAKIRLNKPIIFYNSYRSTTFSPLHMEISPEEKLIKPSKAQIGEEAIIEMLLLSRCDYLVRTFSNVSSVSVLFNPNLPNIVIRK